MKKFKIISYLVIIFICAINLNVHTALAEIKLDVMFDEKTHLFEGQTEPEATIYIEGVAGFINADKDGKFALTLPEDQKEITFTIMQLDTGDEKDFTFKLADLTTSSSTTASTSTTTTSEPEPSTAKEDIPGNLIEEHNDSSNLVTDNSLLMTSDALVTSSSIKKATDSSEKLTKDSTSLANIYKDTTQMKKNGITLFTISVILIIILLIAMYYYKKKNNLNNQNNNNKDD